MTSQTRQFIWAMRILALIYLLTGLMFFFRPDETFYILNIGPKVFQAYQEIPLSSERFWLVIATSTTVMLTIVALYSSLYPKVFGFVLIHLASKATSVAGFLYLFLHGNPYFAYLLAAIADSLIFILVFGFYIRHMASKPKPVAEPVTATAETAHTPESAEEHTTIETTNDHKS